MLIEFSVENFRSISKRQVLSLVADKKNDKFETNGFEVRSKQPLRLLRSAAVYGANAAGKSNLIKALSAMQKIVHHSAKEGQLGDTIPVQPFLFTSETAREPTEFEVVFFQDGVRYQYGFAATQRQVMSEWLFAYPYGKAQRWFQREYSVTEEKYVWHFGDKFTGQRQLWQQATRDNALFLSTAIQLNSHQLVPVFKWFNETLVVIQPGAGFRLEHTLAQCQTEEGKQRIMTFLNAADLGIQDIELEKQKGQTFTINFDFAKAKAVTTERPAYADITVVKFMHKRAKGEFVPILLEDESDGTRKLFSMAGPWLDVLARGCALVIDEINNSLHPLMVRFLVQMFHDPEVNHKNAQLVFSTHETSVLTQTIFRRDQIWFVEKDKSDSTILYPLTDFSPRKSVEPIEKNYLVGRYGGLPYFRNFKLGEEEYH